MSKKLVIISISIGLLILATTGVLAWKFVEYKNSQETEVIRLNVLIKQKDDRISDLESGSSSWQLKYYNETSAYLSTRQKLINVLQSIGVQVVDI